MGWISDFLSDPVNTVTKTAGDAVNDIGSGINTVRNAVGDVAQGIGDKVGNAWQSSYNNLDNYWKDYTELMNNNIETLQKGAQLATSFDPRDVFAVGKYKKLMDEQLHKDNEIGDEEFGEGGWVHGGLNAAGYYYGAGPVGDYYYQATDAMQGRNYAEHGGGGRSAGPQSLYNMYKAGTGAYNAANANPAGSDLPTDSQTYTEAGPGGTTVAVNPSQYTGYSAAGSGAAGLNNSSGTSNTGTNMDFNDYTNNSYTTPDLGTLGTGTYGAGNPYAGNVGTGGLNTGIDLSGVAQATPPSMLDQTSDFLNSGLGRVGRAGLTAVNPMAGGAVNTLSDLLAGNYSGAASGVGGLYQTYLNNKLNRQNMDAAKNYQGQINSQIQKLNDLYTPNSPYAQQMRESLSRQDAASGRRSQYGPREIQLQAALAEKQAGLAPAMNGLTSQAYQSALQQQQLSRLGKTADTKAALNTLFAPSKTSTGTEQSPVTTGIAQGAKQGWDYITSLFG